MAGTLLGIEVAQKTKLKKSPPRRDSTCARAKAKREHWKRPEYRALMAKRHKEHTAKRQLDTKANWRFGIPNGMRRAEAEREWYFARMYAKEVTRIMVDKEVIPDDERVTKAFTSAVEVLESPMSQAVKLQAARLILDFLKAKPVSKSEVTVAKAEDWLAQVIADNGGPD